MNSGPTSILRQTRSGTHGSAWRASAAACVVCMAAACKEGYPTEDESLLSPSEMSQPQLLDALDRVGQRPHLKPRRSYRLLPGCELEVTVHAVGGRESSSVPLDGATVEARIDVDKTYSLLLIAKRSAANQVVALEGGKWVDSVQMRSLLSQLQGGCTQADEPTK